MQELGFKSAVVRMHVDHENSNILPVKEYTGMNTMEITQMFINNSMDKQIVVFHTITCYVVMGMNKQHVNSIYKLPKHNAENEKPNILHKCCHKLDFQHLSTFFIYSCLWLVFSSYTPIANNNLINVKTDLTVTLMCISHTTTELLFFL